MTIPNWLRKYSTRGVFSFLAAYGFIIYLTITDRNYLKLAPILLVIGGTLNFLALVFNQGQMPVKQYRGKGHTHRNLTKNSRLKPLCDIFKIRTPLVHVTVSIGDILILSAVLYAFIHG